MKKRVIIGAALVAVVAGALAVSADDRGQKIREFLLGIKEAPAVVSTTGNGTFRATIDDENQVIKYTLSFADLEGDVLQAHIHIGHPQNSGGIVLWLCDTAANPSPVASTPACFDNPADTRANTVSGELTPADVRAAAANGIDPGEFDEVVALIRAGRTYVNVHSTKFPPGEIRSQIEHGGGHGPGSH
jgi:hypothetical protein